MALDPSVREAIRAEYEGREDTVVHIAEKYQISVRALYLMVRRYGWKYRAPRRMDPNDMVSRLLRLIETQIIKLEFEMDDPKGNEDAVLTRLSGALDRLLETRAQIAPKRERSTRTSALARELRQKVADRIAALNEG
ncbi:MAG TPA: hypothetical protein VG757_13475 [Devosia sp.]|nr:hypothetical protein [Devosia sp.]